MDNVNEDIDSSALTMRGAMDLTKDRWQCRNVGHPFVPIATKWLASGTIFIVPLQVHCYLEALLTTTRILCRISHPRRHRQLRVKDLPKVPTWRLERDSNLRPFGRNSPNLPMSHQTPQ